MILLLDTSNKTPFLALINNSEVVDIEHFEGSSSLSRTLYPSLDLLLRRNLLTSGSLKRVVYGKGPGSFLGIRTAANLSSALQCSLNAEISSFISPLAYLPFQEGGFAYFLRSKGGKYPVLLGIKNELESKITSSHLLSGFNEFFELQEAKDAKINYVVADPTIKKEIEMASANRGSGGLFNVCESEVDRTFLPVLAEISILGLNTESPDSSAPSPFGLVY